jgi:hypothetical protein
MTAERGSATKTADVEPTPRQSAQDVAAAEDSDQVFAVEEKVCRCDACGAWFALIYSRMKQTHGYNDTVVHSVSLPCPRPGCQHGSRYFVPMNARGVMIREWWGSADVSPKPSLDEIVRRSDAAAAPGALRSVSAPPGESAGAAQQGDEADER